MAVVSFEFVGSADGLAEITDLLDQVGVLLQVGVPFVLVLLQLVDLAG